MTADKLGTAELLFRSASQKGLQPAWLERDVLFAITTPHGERYVNYAKSSLNSQLSSSMAGNKLATRLVLGRHDLPSMEYLSPSNRTDAEDFLKKYKKIIVKPLYGSNSRDVHIVEAPGQLPSLDGQEYIFEEYAPGKEIRYLLLNGKVIGVHESQYGESVAEDRALLRISQPESEWDSALAELSLKVAKIFGLRYAAVDYIIGPDGKARILEVNSSPGLKWFHDPSSGPTIDVADLFIEAMLEEQKVQPQTAELGSTPII